MSKFPPDTGGEGGHLFRLTCSLCCGDRRTLQTNTTGMCGDCSQCIDHTGFATAQGSMYFPGPHCPGSRVLCKGPVLSGPAFHALTKCKPLRFSGTPQGHRPRWAVCFVLFPGPCSPGDWVLGEHTVPDGHCVLFISPVLDTQFPRCSVNALSQVCCVSPLGR